MNKLYLLLAVFWFAVAIGIMALGAAILRWIKQGKEK